MQRDFLRVQELRFSFVERCRFGRRQAGVPLPVAVLASTEAHPFFGVELPEHPTPATALHVALWARRTVEPMKNLQIRRLAAVGSCLHVPPHIRSIVRMPKSSRHF